MADYRRWLVFFLFVTFFQTRSLAAQTIRVDEDKTRMEGPGNDLELHLAIVNTAAKNTPAHVELKFLSPTDTVAKSITQEIVARPGTNDFKFHITGFLSALKKDERENLPWYRLQYSLSANLNSNGSHGIVSFSKMMPQTFQVQFGAPEKPLSGKPWSVHVFTQERNSNMPVKDVEITSHLTITVEDKDRVMTATGRTDATGHTLLTYKIPENIDGADLTLNVRAKRGKELRDAHDDFSIRNSNSVFITTDKPIYQPNQDLHTRILAFDSSGNVLVGKQLQFEVSSPDGVAVFHAEIVTSRFGEAHMDWTIPDNARLGNYSINVRQKDERFVGTARITLSRYELPTFTVRATPDRPYYTDGQNAAIAIQTDFLFGQPVSRAHVRLTEDEPNEPTITEGESDDQGQFVAVLERIGRYIRGIQDSDRNFNDLSFTAYATDPATKRTEERHFAIRVTRDPIHIYVGMPHSLTKGLPVEFYVATQYVDGSPVESQVEIWPVVDKDPYDLDAKTFAPNGVPTATVRTNRLGVGKISGPEWDKLFAGREDDLTLFLRADDGQGSRGTQISELRFADSAIQIHTDKIAYAMGDPIRVQIQSSIKTGPVVLDLMNGHEVLQSEVLRFVDGKASTMFRYNDEFQGDLTIEAHYAGSDSEDANDESKTVVFPSTNRLTVEVSPEKPLYNPGAAATLSLHVHDDAHPNRNSILGVVVVDRAVEERAQSSDTRISNNDDQIERTQKELAKSNRNEPLPDDLNLAIDYMLNATAGFSAGSHRSYSTDDIGTPKNAFQNRFKAQFENLRMTLNTITGIEEYPTGEALWIAGIFKAGIDRNAFLDPWGSPFIPRFHDVDLNRSVTVWSAGPDKQPNTDDDFAAFEFSWPYFQPKKNILNRAVQDHRDRSGEFVRDMTSLQKALSQYGEDISTWRDPWGHPYRITFSVDKTRFRIDISSSGPNGKFEPEGALRSDDQPVWTFSIEYNSEIRRTLQQAANRYYQENKMVPETPIQLDQAIEKAGIPDSELSDPWGHRLYSFLEKTYEYADSPVSSFFDKEVVYADYVESQRQSVNIVPQTREITRLTLRSAGPDGVKGTSDDFNMAHFSQFAAELFANDLEQNSKTAIPVPNEPGVLHGIVTDASGARIPGAQVLLISAGALQREARTNDAGEYAIESLPDGFYEARFEFPGFQTLSIFDVPIRHKLTELNAVLRTFGVFETMSSVGGASFSVGSNLSVERVDAEIGRSETKQKAVRTDQEAAKAVFNFPMQTSTPRLREYFPETLVWQPALETDRNGNAQIHFKLADNITEWRIRAIASSVDGKVGYGESSVISYQPFFLEHDPPRVLTEGDRIALPVVIRSYLNKAQSLDLSLKPESWFTTSGALNQKTEIKAGETARATFDFKAIASIKDGKQRVTAIGTEASDNIEKPVTVHPDGREVVQTESRIFTGQSAFDTNFPRDVLPNTARVELKIYPDLTSHVAGAIEGILQRPAGCAEQVISLAYPSLFLLRESKTNPKMSGPLLARARKYLESGYVNLLSFQSSEGGFSYWGSGASDIAVTAYAVDFLQDAAGSIDVDERVVQRAQIWLSKQQRPDGSWSNANSISPDSPTSVLTLTSLVTRVMSKHASGIDIDKATTQTVTAAAARAVKYVRDNAAQWGEPYSLANLALTSIASGDRDNAKWALAQFQRTVHKEGDTVFWDLQTNSPFFGWGLAGRLETTALCVRALAEGQAAGMTNESTQTSIDSGLLFLLRNKDRYGVWYSTQATVRVLDALVRLIGADSGKTRSSKSGKTDVLINGVRIDTIDLNSAPSTGGPITVDVTRFLKPGPNRVEIRGNGPAGKATVQWIETYYVPWIQDANPAGALRLNVKFDKTDGVVGNEVTCLVHAERNGFRGYGMMLAEIGLPPGADVDRASLDSAIGTTAGVFRYDVLPDRIVVYLWPTAGGSDFKFKFRMRYGLDAQTAASTLYDYYNPDEQTVVTPTRFVVH